MATSKTNRKKTLSRFMLDLLDSKETSLGKFDFYDALRKDQTYYALLASRGSTSREVKTAAELKTIVRYMKDLHGDRIGSKQVTTRITNSEDGTSQLTCALVSLPSYGNSTNKRKMANRDASFFEDFSHSLGVAINDRFMQAYMPSRSYQLFSRAMDNVQDSQIQERVALLMGSIEVMQRGQPLLPGREIPPKILDAIYLAILDRKQISVAYKEVATPVILHPIGVVFRAPKIFLVAFNQKEQKVNIYSVEKIRQVTPLEKEIRKEIITLKEFIATGAFSLCPQEFPKRKDVVFRILQANLDNLAYDLKAHPLSTSQVIRKLPGNELQVSLKNERISWQLIEWLLGRMSRVVVENPPELRSFIRQELTKMLGNYERRPCIPRSAGCRRRQLFEIFE